MSLICNYCETLQKKGVFVRNQNPIEKFKNIQLKEFEFIIQKKELDMYNNKKNSVPDYIPKNYEPVYLSTKEKLNKQETLKNLTRSEFYQKTIEALITYKNIDFDYVIDYISFQDLDKENPYAEYLTKEFFGSQYFKENFKNLIFNPNKHVINEEAYDFLISIDNKISIF